METIYYIIITAGAVVVFFVFVLLFRRMLLSRTDELGKRKVNGILKRFGVFRGYKLIKDIELPVGNDYTCCDSILVGYFGIILIKTCGVKGEYYGAGYDKSWIFTKKSNGNSPKKYIPNPNKVLDQNINAIRDILKKEEIYKVSIDAVLVTTIEKNRFFVTKLDYPLMTEKELKKLLSKSKYESDSGIDIEKIVSALDKYAKKQK